MGNISLALAFLISQLFSLGSYIMKLAIGLPLLHGLSSYQQYIAKIFSDYWIPTILIWLLLRSTRFGSWLKPNTAIHVIIWIANLSLLSLVALRIQALTSSSSSDGLAILSTLIAIPAYLLMLIGLFWLLIRSVREEKTDVSGFYPAQQKPIKPMERIVVIAVFSIPIISGLPFFAGENAPYHLANAAGKLFQEHCTVAREQIIKIPDKVQSLYLDPDGGENFDHIKRDIYSSSGNGVIGLSLINGGHLLFYETRNSLPYSSDGSSQKYRKFLLGDFRGKPVDEITSKYGVFTTELTSESEKRFGYRGHEVKIVNLRTKEMLSNTIYYVSRSERKFCGNAPGGNYYVVTFITNALNLKRQYPSIYP